MRRLLMLFLLFTMSLQSAWAMVDLCVELPGTVASAESQAVAEAATAADELHEKEGYCNCCSCCVACHGGSQAPLAWPGGLQQPELPPFLATPLAETLHANSYLERPERPKWLAA